MDTKNFSAGETIIAEGTYGSQTFRVARGQVEICKETGKKGRIRLALLSEGEVFGEMYLFDDTGFRSASVVAISDVTVEIIPRQEMERQLAATPDIVISIMKTLSSRLAQTSQENSLLKFQLGKNPLRALTELFTR
jgi:cAMP-dependent protein kinase regulator